MSQALPIMYFTLMQGKKKAAKNCPFKLSLTLPSYFWGD
jgi:hypothetical protein